MYEMAVRYSVLLDLYNVLPRKRSLPFPPKRSLTSQTPEFLLQRGMALADYLEGVLTDSETRIQAERRLLAYARTEAETIAACAPLQSPAGVGADIQPSPSARGYQLRSQPTPLALSTPGSPRTLQTPTSHTHSTPLVPSRMHGRTPNVMTTPKKTLRPSAVQLVLNHPEPAYDRSGPDHLQSNAYEPLDGSNGGHKSDTCCAELCDEVCSPCPGLCEQLGEWIAYCCSGPSAAWSKSSTSCQNTVCTVSTHPTHLQRACSMDRHTLLAYAW